ncbi:hypothetical protein A3A93_00985 [Candidatus Roizmanbacteria bacterium RIFCSPLOWO2_01_FULL_38_12]|uniref:histidine kinase n=1 Tax=Candidatus Roizmanbacteria bacterium RIFCSPLOWO2_01_FULL_38_12 TaxID=1802061 RepID=A0A1F7IR86_9BACT|nr:MAG: hypothetical protein A2861_01760 [Candidatus Roizmanbacteria bacterium RIFCSPHIGHO2_01_FULL_38_15]OGK34750.1 MAG: hypothetical protein A3F59_04445 [Candidatus Roizmanbacteria bacterium RIFCSPHIGHO2_12_FULL_38_13]OGK45868.1 MAG: hypothetical protein A3A93_00985 [Candidatus Roizmanbacteria bacterium RIFCSPLOWO2_01_FULL_38_12]
MFNFLKNADNENCSRELTLFKEAFDSSITHMVITDPNGCIIHANKAAQDTTGYYISEMLGKTPQLWRDQINEEFYQKLWFTIGRNKKAFVGELKNQKKDGTKYTVIARISPILTESGNIIGFISTEEDISSRVSLEAELHRQNTISSQEKQRDEAILLNISDGVVALDENGIVSLASEAAILMLRFPREELTGKSYVEVVLSEDEFGNRIAVEKRGIIRAITTLKKIHEIVVYHRKDGTKFTADVTNTPIITNGKLYGHVIVFRDVTTEKQIDRAKSEFISLASHQLRTPLTTINWYIELLLSGDAGIINAEQKKFLEEAYTGSRRMAQLINALLNVSRIESDTYMISPEPVDLLRIVRSTLDELKIKIDEKNLHVNLIKDVIPIISLDPSLMTIIMQNLLTNAVKYTPENGMINVYLKILKPQQKADDVNVEIESVLIQIADNGMGIPKEQQAKIFTKMFRADNVRIQDPQGTGLGLYMIKRLIERSNGKIWFRSEENKGTAFYVILPVSGMEKKSGSKKLN